MRPASPAFRRPTAFAAIILLLTLPASAQTQAPPDPSTQPSGGSTPSSPLTIHVGDADLLFGGFIDATAIRRDANTSSGLGTSDNCGLQGTRIALTLLEAHHIIRPQIGLYRPRSGSHARTCKTRPRKGARCVDGFGQLRA
jgi:hypothetical protein